jgi:hypothetical protein
MAESRFENGDVPGTRIDRRLDTARSRDDQESVLLEVDLTRTDRPVESAQFAARMSLGEVSVDEGPYQDHANEDEHDGKKPLVDSTLESQRTRLGGILC